MKLHKKIQYLCLYCEYVCVIKCVLLFLLWGAMEKCFSGVTTAFAESTLFSSAHCNLAMMHSKSVVVSKRWIWFSAQQTPKRFNLCLGKHIEIKHAKWICQEPMGVNIVQKNKNNNELERHDAFSDRKRTKVFLSLPSDCIYSDWRSLAIFRKAPWMAIVAWSEWLSQLTVLPQSTETERQTFHATGSTE